MNVLETHRDGVQNLRFALVLRPFVQHFPQSSGIDTMFVRTNLWSDVRHKLKSASG